MLHRSQRHAKVAAGFCCNSRFAIEFYSNVSVDALPDDAKTGRRALFYLYEQDGLRACNSNGSQIAKRQSESLFTQLGKFDRGRPFLAFTRQRHDRPDSVFRMLDIHPDFVAFRMQPNI